MYELFSIEKIINFLPKFIQKILLKIAFIGVNHELNRNHHLQIIISNILYVICITFSFSFSIFYYLFDYFQIANLVMLEVLAGFISLILAYFGFHLLARQLTYISSCIIVLATSLFWGSDAHVQFLFFPLIVNIFILFRRDQIWNRCLSLIISITSFAVSSEWIVIEFQGWKHLEKTDELINLISHINEFASITLIIIPIVLLSFFNDKIEALNQKLSSNIIEVTKNLSLSHLAESLSHELNSPLTILLLQSQRLRRTILKLNQNNELITIVDKLDDTVAKMSQILKTIKQLNQTNTAKTYKLNSILVLKSEILTHLETSLKEFNGHLNHQLFSEEFKIYCDKNQIVQSISSLVRLVLKIVSESNTSNSKNLIKKDSINVDLLISEENERAIFKVRFKRINFSNDLDQILSNPFQVASISNRELIPSELLTVTLVIHQHMGTISYKASDINSMFTIELPISLKSLS